MRERELALSFPRRQSRQLALPHGKRELAFAHSRRFALRRWSEWALLMLAAMIGVAAMLRMR